MERPVDSSSWLKRSIPFVTAVALASGVLAQSTPTPPAQPPPAAEADPLAAPAPPPCKPSEAGLRFICNQPRAEDLFHIVGTDWVIVSYLAAGVSAVNYRTHETVKLYPVAGAKELLDKNLYGACPGVPSAEQKARFGVAGIGVGPLQNGTYTVYAVHYGQERAVDVIEVDLRGARPSGTWVGCVLAPDPIGLDDVVVLPEGGFLGTNWLARGAAAKENRARMMAGQNNGELWEWHSKSGWMKVPGSDSVGPNGIELSKDGKWIYFAGWGDRKFYRLERGVPSPRKEGVDVGFRLDNINWAPDGTMLGAGQTCFGEDDCKAHPVQKVHLTKIDVNTMRATSLADRPEDKLFGGATGAIQIGNDIWVGSYRSDRIAIFPAR